MILFFFLWLFGLNNKNTEIDVEYDKPPQDPLLPIAYRAMSDQELNQYIESSTSIFHGLTICPTNAWVEKARRNLINNY